MVVFGGGTGGLVMASIAASSGARVALVERNPTGGDCLSTGCVPSKSLIETAAPAQRMRYADSVGLRPIEPEIDFGAVMEHVRNDTRRARPHDSPERLKRADVEVIIGHGRFVGPWRIAVGERELRCRTAVIATGSRARSCRPGLAGAVPGLVQRTHAIAPRKTCFSQAASLRGHRS